jgi:hypothetical protein
MGELSDLIATWRNYRDILIDSMGLSEGTPKWIHYNAKVQTIDMVIRDAQELLEGMYRSNNGR